MNTVDELVDYRVDDSFALFHIVQVLIASIRFHDMTVLLIAILLKALDQPLLLIQWDLTEFPEDFTDASHTSLFLLKEFLLN